MFLDGLDKKKWLVAESPLHAAKCGQLLTNPLP